MAWTIRLGKSFPYRGVSFGNLAATIRFWRDRARSRRQLRWLTDRQLMDIGIDRGMAMEEARKPFWRN